MSTGFPHESLDCYRLAVSVARWVAAARFPSRHASLADQAVRAAQSVVLNIAEGAGRTGLPAKNHFRIALGSAAEVSAVLERLVDPPRLDPGTSPSQQVGATLLEGQGDGLGEAHPST